MKNITLLLVIVICAFGCRKQNFIILPPVPPITDTVNDTVTIKDTVNTFTSFPILGDWSCLNPSTFKLKISKNYFQWDAPLTSFFSVVSFDTIYWRFPDMSVSPQYTYSISLNGDTLFLISLGLSPYDNLTLVR